MLRVVLPLIALAMLVIAQGPPRELFCATAGQLGLAGENPNIMFTVFERGSWRPAAAYIESENVTFVLVPAVARNNTDPAKAVVRGALPPPVLRNDTVVCFEAAPGRPAAVPPAPGLLIAVERRGAVYHVYVSRAGDVDNPANYTLAQPGRPEGKRPDKIELVDRRPAARGRGKTQPEAGIQQISTLSYWAAFKLYRLTTQSLQPGGCVSTVFDVPDGTSQAAVVLTGGTTPGTYSYLIFNNWNPSQRWSGTVSVLSGQPQTVVAWLPAGRAQYTVQICNQNSQPAAIYASALVSASNSQYLRNDVVRMTPSWIPQYICTTACIPFNNWLKSSNNYLAVPGFYVDAASSITVSINLRVPKSATTGTVYVYWGGLYIGSLSGGTDPSNPSYMVFSGTLTVPQSLYTALLPTYGLGGVISIGPLNPPDGSYLAVTVAVRRPVELAPAGDSLYNMPVKVVKESLVVTNTKAFITDLEATASYGIALAISTKPFNTPRDSSYSFIRMTVNALDASLNPVQLSGATSGIVVTSGSSWLLESLPFLSLVMSIYDLAKSTIDALKNAVQSFPIIGFVTLAIDNFVQTASASIKVWTSGNSVTVELYTGWYNDPLVANVTVAAATRPTYLYISRVEYTTPYYPWYTVYSVDGPALPNTSIGTIPQGGQISYFPYRTLTCGAQESRIPKSWNCINDYFR
ncbi:hypothetical protein ODS41_04105 [Pyrobaculum sp. 3827-6]|uniref:hypothetical protein n=1 Tax=Pyrobaculum sp. 3827-6 TaxID=2983604 RepID=UPI0021D813F9|nr:hypothetical protein [Pyrobaculum sp. 3827-6]MCU7787110.1 hypothetical protein [Pyrobaculum sp. 3827-6]